MKENISMKTKKYQHNALMISLLFLVLLVCKMFYISVPGFFEAFTQIFDALFALKHVVKIKRFVESGISLHGS